MLRIANYQHIAAAYGDAVASRLPSLLLAALPDLCDGAAIAISGEWRPKRQPVAAELVADAAAFLFVPAAMGGPSFAMFASELLARISARPFVVGAADGQPVRLRLLAEARWWAAAKFDGERGHAELRALDGRPGGDPFCGTPIPRSDMAIRIYRADMAETDRTIEALSEGGHCLAWQPVVRVPGDHARSILYFEARSRFLAGVAGFVPMGTAAGALERTGLIRLLDRAVAMHVLGELETAVEDVALAFNMSSLSAVDDLWWEPFWAALGRSPSLGARLFVELTDSAPVQGLSLAAAFVSRLRRAGGHLVLDQFGAGYASVREAFALVPDAIKISGTFLPAAGAERAIRLFAPLAGLAAGAGAAVIASHVETMEQVEFAIGAGAGWCQGDHFAPPSLLRPWVVEGGSSGAGVRRALLDLYRLKFSAREYGRDMGRANVS